MNYREKFRLRPIAGVFDIPAIQDYLVSCEYVDARKDRTNGFLIGDSREDIRAEQRAFASKGSYSYMASAVELNEHEIIVYNAAYEPTLRNAQAFVQWMLDHYAFTITDEYSVDLTDIAKGDAANIYPTELT